jgi:hypothetical protein
MITCTVADVLISRKYEYVAGEDTSHGNKIYFRNTLKSTPNDVK